jgi:hypothetical protein
MKNRSLNRAYARAAGYFWFPCPVCGQEFGGHEWRETEGKRGSIPAPDGPQGMGNCICPDCMEAGRGHDDPIYMAKLDQWAEEQYALHPEWERP